MDSSRINATRVSQLKAAATTVPGHTTDPISGLIDNQIEQVLQSFPSYDGYLLEMLREAFRRGVFAANLTVREMCHE